MSVDTNNHLGFSEEALPGSGQLILRDNAAGARHTVLATGDIDIASAPELENTVAGLCDSGATSITLDLSEVSFVDSTGLRAAVMAYELCEQHGCEFLVRPGTGAVRRLLDLTNLDRVLPLQA